MRVDGWDRAGKNGGHVDLGLGDALLSCLAVGALVSVICASIPPLLRFALSAALWCAVWGPCLSGWILFTGLALLADGVAKESMHMQRAPIDFHRLAGLPFLSLALLSSAALGSLAAWMHQIIIRRMTFALFRIYSTLVSAGIGSVWGWALGWWMAATEMIWKVPLWIGGTMILVASFGYAGFRGARQLRGAFPMRFSWLTKEEYEGTV
jgi:hypothetical protein